MEAQTWTLLVKYAKTMDMKYGGLDLSAIDATDFIEFFSRIENEPRHTVFNLVGGIDVLIRSQCTSDSCIRLFWMNLHAMQLFRIWIFNMYHGLLVNCTMEMQNTFWPEHIILSHWSEMSVWFPSCATWRTLTVCEKINYFIMQLE